jgi:hypothetical protein
MQLPADRLLDDREGLARTSHIRVKARNAITPLLGSERSLAMQCRRLADEGRLTTGARLRRRNPE